MRLTTTRFGEIEVPDECVFQFADGVPGFPVDKTFAFVPHDKDGESPFAYLQSANTPELTFLLADPFAFFADYEFSLPDDQAAQLGFTEGNLPAVYVIVSIPDKAEDMTANLLAPVLLNWRDKSGCQVIAEKTAYTTKHRLFPQGLAQETKQEENCHAGAQP